MGHFSSYEQMALRWLQVCADPLLRDVPGKVELNALGVIEMSPANTRHARLQMQIGITLQQQLPDGTAFAECPIATTEGVRVPDVAWASAAFMAQQGDMSPFSRAPEICVEVLSPGNTPSEMELKTAAYLGAGAVEVWLVDQDGTRKVYDAEVQRAGSRYPVTLPRP